MTPSVAAVVLAHDRPAHLHRLIGALAPMPVFLHVDAGTPDRVYAEMVRNLPERVRLLPRIRTAWASLGLVHAELEGYRQALAHTDARHIALLSGADYPLSSVAALEQFLAQRPGMSYLEISPLPVRGWGWGPTYGYDRFLVPNWSVRGHRTALPVPRRLPAGLRPAGGSQWKVLSREHVSTVLSTLAERPDIMAFFRRVWVPDETLLPSLLLSPALGGEEHPGAFGHSLWHLDWRGWRPKGPACLTDPADWAAVSAAAPTRKFARKFTDGSVALLDRIDTELRS